MFLILPTRATRFSNIFRRNLIVRTLVCEKSEVQCFSLQSDNSIHTVDSLL